MNMADLLTCVAYFSIPVQLIVSLLKYQNLAKVPFRIRILFVLFSFFILLCGVGHLFRCLDKTNTVLFQYFNWATAFVSLATALYLFPLAPQFLSALDRTVNDLVILNEETEESRRKLFTFMAFLCHEIRNPLFAITSSATTLEDTELTPEQTVALGSILDAAELMLQLVNDVLDLSKIDAGKLRLEEKPFDLYRIFNSLAHTIRNQVKIKHGTNVEFGLSIAPDVPRAISGDPTRILQIVYNLLSNSLKFTTKGRVDLKVSICSYQRTTEILGAKNDESDALLANIEKDRKGGDDSSMFKMDLVDFADNGKSEIPAVILKIEVKDTGIGIEPSRLSNIFQPYTQAKLSDYRMHGGTGLGLSIISGLTKAMGGTISATSSLGCGTTFTVEIPVIVAENVDDKVYEDLNAQFIGNNLHLTIHPSTISSIELSQRKKKSKDQTNQRAIQKLIPFKLTHHENMVLIVDDNLVNQKILGKMLRYFNLQYRVAGNGQEAVDIIFHNSRNLNPSRKDFPYYALIFMDLSMPVMDGYTAISILRNQELLIPIIALTANALQQERDRAKAVGATDFQTKPILRPKFYEICRYYLLQNT